MVIVGLDGPAVFVAEGAVVFRVTLGSARINVGALHRCQHRVLAVAEIVRFHEHGRTERRACAVLGVAIVVVVVDVGAVVTHARMAAVGMVVPVVVIRDVKPVGRAFGKPEQIGLAVVPEMIVAERDVRRFFAVQGAVTLDLVLVAAGMAVEKVAVVHPDVLVVLLEADVVAFVGIHVHDADIADFDILSVLDADAPAVRRSVVADPFKSQRKPLFFAKIYENIALVGHFRVRHVANQADGDWTLVIALL